MRALLGLLLGTLSSRSGRCVRVAKVPGPHRRGYCFLRERNAARLFPAAAAASFEALLQRDLPVVKSPTRRSRSAPCGLTRQSPSTTCGARRCVPRRSALRRGQNRRAPRGGCPLLATISRETAHLSTDRWRGPQLCVTSATCLQWLGRESDPRHADFQSVERVAPRVPASSLCSVAPPHADGSSGRCLRISPLGRAPPVTESVTRILGLGRLTARPGPGWEQPPSTPGSAHDRCPQRTSRSGESGSTALSRCRGSTRGGAC